MTTTDRDRLDAMDRDRLDAMARAYAQDVYGLDEPDERCYRIAHGLLIDDPGLDPQAAVLDHHAEALDAVAADLATLSAGGPDAPEAQAIEWTRNAARLLRTMRDQLEPAGDGDALWDGWYVVSASIPATLSVRVCAASAGEAEDEGSRLLALGARRIDDLPPLRVAVEDSTVTVDLDTREWDDLRVAPD